MKLGASLVGYGDRDALVGTHLQETAQTHALTQLHPRVGKSCTRAVCSEVNHTHSMVVPCLDKSVCILQQWACKARWHDWHNNLINHAFSSVAASRI